MKTSSFRNEFVDYLPEQLDEGVLYISMRHRTVAHLCACGCRSEVVTPLAPTEWGLHFDGVGVSLSPSVGNWNFACRSHYFIRGGHVQWAGNMSSAAIERGRLHSQAMRQGKGVNTSQDAKVAAKVSSSPKAMDDVQQTVGRESLWSRCRKFLFGGG